MKIAGIQFACTRDKDRNVNTAIKLLNAALNEKAKIICFQELFHGPYFGITQEELADVIGVHRRVIGDMERGKPNLQLRIALAATRALGLDILLAPRDR